MQPLPGRLALVLAPLGLAPLPCAQQARSAAAPAVFVAPELAPPSRLVVYPCGNSAELHWRDESSAEVGFVVLRRPAGGGAFHEVGLSAPDETRFVDSVPNGSFDYRVAARGAFLDSPTSNQVSASFPNLPPVITTDLAADQSANLAGELRFTVTVSDPEGDRVALRILNPPPGMIFDPLEGAPSPAGVAVRWRRERNEELDPRLVFEADCGVRLVRDVRLADNQFSDTALLIGDVSGDGRLDAVVTDEHAGASDGGAILVFAGATVPLAAPSATLSVAGDDLRPRNGDARNYVQLADVTGDGVLDVVSHSVSQKVYVWAGGAGLSGTPAPAATLVPPGTSATFSIFEDNVVPLLQLVDLSGDGVPDVTTYDRMADVGAVSDAGAVFFWLGGAGLAGTVAPTRTLTVPGAKSGDWLGHGLSIGEEGGVELADVTGDGVLDFLVAAPRADIGAVVDAGAVYLWSGAAVLAGSSTPTATLTAPGYPDSIGQILIGDLGGDGIVDVIAGRPNTPLSGMAEVGAFHLWTGGAWTGVKPASCTFRIAGASAYHRLGRSFAGLADVTGDGRLDFVTLTPAATFQGVLEAGAIHVWAGGSLSGTPAPSATLGIGGATEGDQLGSTGDLAPLQLVDLTGDGVLDLVTGSFFADAGGVVDAGAIYVWNGGALAGAVTPSATLRVPAAAPSSLLTEYSGIAIEDLDGDGALDIRAATPEVTLGGIARAGAVHVWSGAGGFAGTESPVLRISHSTGGRIWNATSADLDGDGFADLLVRAFDNPRLFFWRGGPTLFGASAPTAVLDGSGAHGPEWIHFTDLDADGFLDVAATYPAATAGGVAYAGSILVWHGGPALGGTLSASATLSVPGARMNDDVGLDGLRFADLTGDGRLELLAISPMVDASASVVDSGAIHAWETSALRAGTNAPLASFALPGASSRDRLGDCTRNY